MCSGRDNNSGSSENLVPTTAQTLENQRRIKQLKEMFVDCSMKQRPLVIHGSPGSGRTTLASMIAQFCRLWLSAPQTVIAMRVFGSSRASNTIEYALSTICYQISEASCCFFAVITICPVNRRLFVIWSSIHWERISSADLMMM